MAASIRLIEQADRGDLDFLVQFGGQGTPWFGELKRAYANPDLARFFDVAIGALEKESKELGPPPGVDFPFQVRSWLNNPDQAPSEDDMEITPISMPLIQLTQLANLEQLHFAGFDRGPMIRNTMAATGHSQGLITAFFFALGKTGDSYYETLELFLRYLQALGHRSQENYPLYQIQQDELQLAEALGVHEPTPMLAILGKDHSWVEGQVESYNATVAREEQVFISLYNSTSNRIVSGHPRSLLGFIEACKKDPASGELKFVFVKSTCPFHSPYMEPVSDSFAKDLDRIGFSFRGTDAKIPIYSFADGRDLRADQNPGLSISRDITVHPLRWNLAIAPLLEKGKDQRETIVIDSGPGKTTQRFTADLVQSSGGSVDTYAAGVPRDFKKLVES